MMFRGSQRTRGRYEPETPDDFGPVVRAPGTGFTVLSGVGVGNDDAGRGAEIICEIGVIEIFVSLGPQRRFPVIVLCGPNAQIGEDRSKAFEGLHQLRSIEKVVVFKGTEGCSIGTSLSLPVLVITEPAWCILGPGGTVGPRNKHLRRLLRTAITNGLAFSVESPTV